MQYFFDIFLKMSHKLLKVSYKMFHKISPNFVQDCNKIFLNFLKFILEFDNISS